MINDIMLPNCNLIRNISLMKSQYSTKKYKYQPQPFKHFSDPAPRYIIHYFLCEHILNDYAGGNKSRWQKNNIQQHIIRIISSRLGIWDVYLLLVHSFDMIRFIGMKLIFTTNHSNMKRSKKRKRKPVCLILLKWFRMVFAIFLFVAQWFTLYICLTAPLRTILFM